LSFTTEFKKNFVEEFLECYQKNPKLSFRQFGLEKLGRIHSSIYVWLKDFDVNNIYKAPSPATNHKNPVSLKNEIVKITNHEIVPMFKKQANISIKVGKTSIDMGKNYSKEDLILVLSALKELSDVN
jgi:hypothetical protein